MNQSLTLSSMAPSGRVPAALRGFLSVLGVAAGAWALSAGMSDAKASDVYWSVGVQSPGVQLGVSNAPPAPVYVQRPRPVYVQPAPVVVYPGYRHVRPVVEVHEPVVVYQAPRYVYVNEGPSYHGRYKEPKWRGDKHRGHGHGRGRGHDRYDD